MTMALCAMGCLAQKKVVIWDGTPFSPAAWDASELRFSDYEGKHFPTLSDDIYWSYKTLIFDISETTDDCYGRVMNGWWSARYDGDVDVHFTNGSWPLQLTEQIARDCARGNGGDGKDLTLMITSGRCTINSVYYIDDEIFLPAEVEQCTERLDSIVTPGYSKEVNAYDADGNRTRYTYFSWNENLGDWVGNMSFEYSYDKQDGLKMVSSVRYVWDKALNGWTASSKTETGYDAHDRQVLTATYNWSAGMWIGQSKYVTAYDENEHQILSASYEWNRGEWQRVYKEEHAYDENDNETFHSYFRWNNVFNELEAGEKSEYEYDVNGLQTLAVSYSWDKFVGDWRGVDKYETSYQANGWLTTFTTYLWNDSVWDWVGHQKEEAESDQNGLLTLHTTYQWNSNNCDWIITDKTRFEYVLNEEGTLPVSYTAYTWDEKIDYWYKSGKADYRYDAKGRQIYFATYVWNAILDDWEGKTRRDNAYEDVNGYQTLEAQYIWRGNQWQGSIKFENKWDENGFHTYTAGYFGWDEMKNDWIGSYRYYITPDEKGHEADVIGWQWDWNLGDWTLASRTELAYDQWNNQTLNASYSWDEYSQAWRGESKNESAFDSMGNQTLEAHYSWDYYSQEWIGSKKWEKTFDAYGNETSLSKYQWDNGLKGWDLGSMSILTYDTSVSGDLVLGISSPSKLLSESLTTLNGGVTTSQRNSTYYYSPTSNSAISQVKSDAGEVQIFNLYGQKVNHMTHGNIYLRGNAKVMTR